MSEDNAARTDSREGPAVRDDARTHSSCSIIACAAYDNRMDGQARLFGKFLADRTSDFRGLIDLGQQCLIDFELFQYLIGPAAVRNIQKLHATRIGNVSRIFSGHAEADVVLRQQDVTTAAVILVFVIADPQDFRRRETGKCRIRRDFNEVFLADAFSDFLTFTACTLVAPDYGRPDDLIFFIEHDQPMHLSRKADALDVCRFDTRIMDDLADCHENGVIPVERFLFSPAVLWLVKRILLRRRGYDVTVRIK